MDRSSAVFNKASELVSLIKFKNGGKGSGNWGHSGRPGKVGGSGKTTAHSASIGWRRRLERANRMAGDDKVAKDFGFKKLSNSGSAEEALKANPGYGKDALYSINCQSCVIAAEMRFRGMDVVAKPRDPVRAYSDKKKTDYTQFLAQDNDCRAFGENYMDGADGKPAKNREDVAEFRKATVRLYGNGSVRRNTPKWTQREIQRMRDHLKQYPEGARVLMSYGYTGRGNYGHITMLQKVPKDVDESGWRVLETQSGKTYSGRLYSFADKRNVTFMRVDDKQLNEVIIGGAVDKASSAKGKEQRDERRKSDK